MILRLVFMTHVNLLSIKYSVSESASNLSNSNNVETAMMNYYINNEVHGVGVSISAE